MARMKDNTLKITTVQQQRLGTQEEYQKHLLSNNNNMICYVRGKVVADFVYNL